MLERAFDAPFHFDEGVAGLADLARAMRAEIEIAALAEILGGAGEAQDRADLVAQEQDRDSEQHDRRAQHPENEDVDVRFISEAAMSEHAQDAVAEIDADFHQP